MSEQEIIARLKKLDEPTFVCRHLAENPYLNLNFPCCREDNEAWCDECEKILEEEGGWTTRSEEFVDIKPYCRYCFSEMKSRYY